MREKKELHPYNTFWVLHEISIRQWDKLTLHWLLLYSPCGWAWVFEIISTMMLRFKILEDQACAIIMSLTNLCDKPSFVYPPICSKYKQKPVWELGIKFLLILGISPCDWSRLVNNLSLSWEILNITWFVVLHNGQASCIGASATIPQEFSKTGSQSFMNFIYGFWQEFITSMVTLQVVQHGYHFTCTTTHLLCIPWQ